MCDYLQFESIFNSNQQNVTFQNIIQINEDQNNNDKYEYNVITQNKTSMIELIMNQPPSNGRCIANRKEGQALKDIFNVTCYNFKDIDNLQSNVLGLKYYFISNDNTLIKQSIDGTFNMIYGKSGIQYLSAVIIDSYGAYICKTLKFIVSPNYNITDILLLRYILSLLMRDV